MCTVVSAPPLDIRLPLRVAEVVVTPKAPEALVTEGE